MNNGSPLRLLAVEDDRDTQRNLRDILELDGYRGRRRWHVSEAAASRISADYFAFILDRKLPDGTAEELLPQIHKAAPSAGILIVTGYADLDGTIAAPSAGRRRLHPQTDRSGLRSAASLIRIRKLREARDRLIQAERLAAIGQMVSGIAHESRNYLQKISASPRSLQMHLRDRSGRSGRTGHDRALLRRTESFARRFAGICGADQARTLPVGHREGLASGLEERCRPPFRQKGRVHRSSSILETHLVLDRCLPNGASLSESVRECAGRLFGAGRLTVRYANGTPDELGANHGLGQRSRSSGAISRPASSSLFSRRRRGERAWDSRSCVESSRPTAAESRLPTSSDGGAAFELEIPRTTTSRRRGID